MKNWKWIICPNKLNGELCKGTIGFIPKNPPDLDYITHPCARCKAMAYVKIRDKKLTIKIFKKKMFRPMYPFVSEGEYHK